MNKIKKVARSTKNFVVNHKAAIACVGLIALHVNVVAKHNQFLKEHDLFDEFYKLED